MLDYTLQAFPPTLNPDLLQTLDKIRAAERKRGYLSSQKENFPTAEKPKKSVTFEKRNGYSQQRNGNDMQIEASPRGLGLLEFNVKKERYSDEKESVKGRKYDDSERRIRARKGEGSGSILKSSQSQNYHARDARGDDDEFYYRQKEEEHFYKRQKISGSQYRSEKSSRSRVLQESEEEDEYDEKMEEEVNNHNHDEEEEVFVSGEPSENEERPKSVNRPKANRMSAPARPRGLNRIKKDIIKEEYQLSGKKSGSHSLKHSQAKSDHKEEPRRRGRPPSSKKKKADDEDFSDEAYIATDDDDDDDEEYEESDDNPSPKRKKGKSDRGVHSLHDWINRRITGYLIFQNTIHDENAERGGREGDHLNRLTGKKWKKLSKSEQEEYKSLAMNARVDLKKEFKDVDKDSPELADFQEQIEKKLKKIKKK